ncbi:MAG: hypothetical protein SGILL_005511 [Bacillariaceae sp.]
MPPREASQNFPDQYLSFDYDAIAMGGGGGAGAGPPHEPFPPVVGGLNGEDAAAASDPAAAAADALNNVQSTTTTPTAGTDGTARSQQQPPSQVDPLSIDPTVTSPWGGGGSNNHNHHNMDMSNTSTRLRLPQMPTMDHQSPLPLPQQQNMSRRVVSSSSSVNVRPSFALGTTPGMAAHHSRRVSTGSVAVTASGGNSVGVALGSPMSVGSTVLNDGGNGPSSSASGWVSPSVESSMTAANANNGSNNNTHSRRSSSSSSNILVTGSATAVTGGVTRPSLTILDSNHPSAAAGASLDNDDEDMEACPPGLDVTYDSMASSSYNTNASQEWEEEGNNNASHIVDDDDEDDDDEQSLSLQSSSPMLVSSNASATSSGTASSYNSAVRNIQQTAAFDMNNSSEEPGSPAGAAAGNDDLTTPTSPNSIMLSFGPNTSVSDLKYFAERGCIVALLQALTTPRLVTLGTRMLADYAKMSHRRVAVASNRRILEFVQRTMLQASEHSDWLGREYAVETVRSLTATEESDKYLMGTYGLLNTLALVARGGPFMKHVQENGTRVTVPLASEKARLHACIAIMNLSCGKANKIEIAKVPEVLEAMRDVMLNSGDEARLKATTCIKNLSNADANDAALLGTPGLVEALGQVASVTCSPETGATPCTTNACLALMNLSISKANKNRVFRTPGVMDALMTVLERTTAQGSSTEARIKACSALSNLAIGYDNKIPMFNYPGFVDAILNVIQTDRGEARTKACSILWSFAAEMKNQVPVVQRADILPVLVRVAEEDGTTEARFKCVAALTLLAESLENAIPLLESGALAPLMEILHEAGPDPTQWKGQTASWCVGFLMNIAQSDEAVPTLREAGVVELLAPLLTLDHYQSLKAAMAVTFVCRYDQGDECYDLLRKTENVIPKIISLLHNTLSGRGGNGYKYGVFTLRSSVGCISALALGPDFMKERIATGPVFESLLRVLSDFCVDDGTPGAIVGGGRDDVLSATLAVRALQSLTAHLIPMPGASALPFGQSMEDRLLVALKSCEASENAELKEETRHLATDAKVRIEGSRKAGRSARRTRDGSVDVDMTDVASLASNCCGLDSLPGFGDKFLHALTLPSDESKKAIPEIGPSSSMVEDPAVPAALPAPQPVRTFLLADVRTGRRFAVPTDPSGGRAFNDTRVWCYRRGRFCQPGEESDPNFVWTQDLQQAYEEALLHQQEQANPAPSESSSAAP